MAYTVYYLTNKINNKKYVGITSQSVYSRWQNGKHYERHKKIYDDILKYGWDSFKHEVLFDNLTKEEAEEKERELIEKWDLINNGYNKQKGGKIHKHNKETIAKISAFNMGDRNPFYNCRHTEETKRLMRENRPKKKVLCVDTGIIYASTREAQRQTGAYHGDISKCCKGEKKIAGGYKWKYA